MKYTCAKCKQGFNTVPYVERTRLQGGEAFCQRQCYNDWLDDNAKVHLPQQHRGNRIKKT